MHSVTGMRKPLLLVGFISSSVLAVTALSRLCLAGQFLYVSDVTDEMGNNAILTVKPLGQLLPLSIHTVLTRCFQFPVATRRCCHQASIY